jgi:hypothetical protein
MAGSSDAGDTEGGTVDVRLRFGVGVKRGFGVGAEPFRRGTANGRYRSHELNAATRPPRI